MFVVFEQFMFMFILFTSIQGYVNDVIFFPQAVQF